MERILFISSFFLLLIFLGCSAQDSSTKILFLDTDICAKVLKKIYPQHNFVRVPGTKGYLIDAECDHPDRRHRKFHGHFVLDTFLKNLPPKASFEIHHGNVFTDRGVGIKEAWEKAVDYENKHSFRFVMGASGYIGQLPKNAKFEAPSFFSVPTRGRKITRRTWVWPQAEAWDNLFLIGMEYISLTGGKPIYLPDQVTFQKPIYLQEMDPRDREVRGTSHALALFMAKFWQICGTQNLKNCLNQNYKISAPKIP